MARLVLAMPTPLDPSRALREALAALEEGDWDHRHHEGARQNALDSIAWSLAGILAHLDRETLEQRGLDHLERIPPKRRRHHGERDVLPLDPMS